MPPSRSGALRQEGAGPLWGAEAEVGGGPGLEVHRQRPGAEEEANTLHWRAEVEQLALGLQPCQGASRSGAFPPSQPRVPSWGQIPRGGQARPHKLLASPPQPQPHLDVGAPG